MLTPARDDPAMNASPAQTLADIRAERAWHAASEWQRTVASIRNVVADLERTCETAGEELREKRGKAAAWISGLIERLVAAAGIEIDFASRRARAEADIDLAQVNALVAHLQAESDAQRREIARLQQQLEAESDRSLKLANAFELFQRAVTTTSPDSGSAQMMAGPAQAMGPAPLQQTSEMGSERAGGKAATNTPAPGAAAASAAPADPDPELTEYVKQLLDQIESRYWVDLKAEMPPAEIVDRLTDNLRDAHDVFGRHLNTANASQTILFDQQLTVLLDAKAESSFGRHLAVAAYNYARPAPAKAARAGAS